MIYLVISLLWSLQYMIMFRLSTKHWQLRRNVAIAVSQQSGNLHKTDDDRFRFNLGSRLHWSMSDHSIAVADTFIDPKPTTVIDQSSNVNGIVSLSNSIDDYFMIIDNILVQQQQSHSDSQDSQTFAPFVAYEHMDEMGDWLQGHCLVFDDINYDDVFNPQIQTGLDDLFTMWYQFTLLQHNPNCRICPSLIVDWSGR